MQTSGTGPYPTRFEGQVELEKPSPDIPELCA
jgi:hypothetical protein